MPCSWARLHMMSAATEPPRCVWSSARPPSNIAAILFGPRDGPVELRLDERDSRVDRVAHQPLVDEVGGVVGQVVLVVREVADRRGRYLRLDEPVRVEAARRRPRLDLVPVTQ